MLLWHWEQGKCQAQQKIGMRSQLAGQSTIPYQVSFNPFSQELIPNPLVTGPKTFVYLKVLANEEKELSFSIDHSQIHNLEEGRELSENYTCHAWCRGDLIVCTERGEILICSSKGEYKQYFLGSPVPQHI